jgi:hypothetical protein
MSRHSNTQQLVESNLGQHLSLSVAAHLARSQLVSNPLAPAYDAQHLNEMLCAIGQALARVTTLYVQETPGGQPRPLAPGELEGARVTRSATTVQLKDGRRLSSVSVKRVDLRNGIAILKTTGVAGVTPPVSVPTAIARARKVTRADQLARLDEVERLMFGRLGGEELARINALAVSIARDASRGRIPNLAMKLLSAIHAARQSGLLDDDARLVLTQLRWACLGAGEDPVLQPAQHPHQRPQHHEINQRGEDDGGRVVSEALRLPRLE